MMSDRTWLKVTLDGLLAQGGIRDYHHKNILDIDAKLRKCVEELEAERDALKEDVDEANDLLGHWSICCECSDPVIDGSKTGGAYCNDCEDKFREDMKSLKARVAEMQALIDGSRHGKFYEEWRRLKARVRELVEVGAMYADMVVKYQRALEEINKQKCNRYVAGNGYTCLEVNATKLCCVCIATKALQEDSHE